MIVLMTTEARKAIADALGYWYDDLRRCHLMATPLAAEEFLLKCADDDEVLAAFADRDDREKAMWMFAFRDQAFRQTELHLSFLAKTNGKYWKKHHIEAGLDPTADRAALEAFSRAVADIYKRAGAGKATHIEVSQREHRIQITLYVEGPVTAPRTSAKTISVASPLASPRETALPTTHRLDLWRPSSRVAPKPQGGAAALRPAPGRP